jgi:hypothetical protein
MVPPVVNTYTVFVKDQTRFPGVRAHLQQLSWKPHGQSEAELMARKYQWCISVSLRFRGAARRSGVPAQTSVDDSEGSARRQFDGPQLRVFVLASWGEDCDRVEAVCCVCDWRTSRNNECAGIPSAGGAVESGAEILRKSGSWCVVCCDGRSPAIGR